MKKRIIALLMGTLIAAGAVVTPFVVKAEENVSEEGVYNVIETNSNGTVTAIDANLHKLESGQMAKILFNGTDTDEDGKLSNQVAIAFEIQTDDTNSFYKLVCANPILSGTITCTVYNEDKTVANLTNANTKISQSKSETVYLKLQKNSKYYITLSAGNKKMDAAEVYFNYEKVLDDAEDIKAYASDIAYDAMYERQINGYGDVDVYKYTTDSTPAYHKIEFGNVDIDNSASISIIDSNEMPVLKYSSAKATTGSKVVYLNPNSTYYIMVSADKNTAMGRYFFKVNKYVDQEGNIFDTSVPLSRAVKAYGGLQTSLDTDVYAFNSANNDTYDVAVNNLGSESDKLEVKITDNKGNEVSKKTVEGQKTAVFSLSKLLLGSNYYVVITGNNSIAYDIVYDLQRKNIIYHLQKGSLDANAPKQFVVGETTKLVKPTRKGYKFMGYYTSDDYDENTKVTAISNLQTSDIEIYAKWEKIRVVLPTDIKSKVTKKTAKINFKRSAGNVSGYEVLISNKKNFKRAKKYIGKRNSVVFTNLRPDTSYYVKIRTYYKYGNNTYYSRSKIVRIKTVAAQKKNTKASSNASSKNTKAKSNKK